MAAASRTTTTDPKTEPTRCGARNRQGRPCARQAGWGTEHLGFGNCRLHGGATPSGIQHAARLQAAAMVADEVDVLEADMEPHDVLLAMVRRAAALVGLYGRKYRELLARADEPEYVAAAAADPTRDSHPLLVQDVTETAWESTGDRGRGTETKASNNVVLHVWGRLYHESIDRAAKLAKLALHAGVDERRVALAERDGEELVNIIRALIDGFGLTPEQLERAPEVVETTLRRFEVIEGGLAA